MVGIWQMSIIKELNENILASLNFLILLSNEDEEHYQQSLNIKYLTIMTNFWSILNMCSTTKDFSLCRDLSNRTISTKLTAINDCFQQQWSVFFHDIKSDW